MQPFLIDITGKKIVIVGGGRIAARKAAVLTKEKPNIIFIAPEFCEEVRTLAWENNYQLLQREAVPADFHEAIVVILATNHREVNERLARSVPSHQLICTTDNVENGNTLFPAIVRRGPLKVAVSTTGASPKLARKLKKVLEGYFDETWTAYTEFLSKCRSIIKRLPIPFEEKDKLLFRLLDDQYRLNKRNREEELTRLKELERCYRETTAQREQS